MKTSSSTRHRIVAVAVLGLAITASFVAGRYWEHFKNGRWYDVHDHRDIATKAGTIRLSHVTDTKGRPFLDGGDSVISLRNGLGLDVKLYQSKRVFQASWPWVDDVQVEDDQLKWSDGVSRYTLRIQPLTPTTQP